MVITRMPLRLLAAERVKKRTLMQNKQQRIIHYSHYPQHQHLTLHFYI